MAASVTDVHMKNVIRYGIVGVGVGRVRLMIRGADWGLNDDPSLSDLAQSLIFLHISYHKTQ